MKKALVVGIIVLFLGVGFQPVTFSISSNIGEINEIDSYLIKKSDGPDLKIMNIDLTLWQESYYDPVLQTIKCDIKKY